MALLCYGTVAGGFLSDRYLGAPAPGDGVDNRSLVKYRLIIDEAGGWDRFQRVLTALARVAARRRCDVGAVAVAWVLQQPGVAAAIVGARHGRHLVSAVTAASLVLDDDDRRDIHDAIDDGTAVPGDVYALERITGGRHAGDHALRIEHRDWGLGTGGWGSIEGLGNRAGSRSAADRMTLT